MSDASIAFTDGTGTATLVCDYPGTPAARFASWVPMTRPVGDSVNRLSDAAVVMFVERTDFGASFTFENLPVKSLATGANMVAVADRLIAWLLQGGTCAVTTGGPASVMYGSCGLWPGASPALQLSDKANLLYTLTLQLVNRAAARMDAVYAT